MITINNRDKLNWQQDLTIKDILKKMNYDYSLISIYLNEEYVPPEEYESREIPDDSSVQIIHLAHGG
ncbi:MAG: MoaD/ThiS family protein [Candidatus Cloacimonetes bacterium]|nr:MoaD/ThiS family protein [Candidatus Cloacimonadota bacterium]